MFPMHTSTSTHAIVEISASAWDEISTILRRAGYHHVFIKNKIVMDGLALTSKALDCTVKPKE